jgi:putative transposase
MPSVEHRSHKGLNNRAENSHQPTRQRERAMKDFRGVVQPSGSCPRSAASHPTSGPRRHLMPAHNYRIEMSIRFAIWEQITGVAGLATAAWAQPGTGLHHAPTHHQTHSHPTT